MEVITIKDLAVSYHVGVPEAERAKPQRLLITVEMKKDVGNACVSDDLSATIDYGAVARRLQSFGQGKSWKLIEKLAHDIAQMILEEFRPAAVAVEVKKFVIPDANYVSVRLERGR
jgi:dihydroneopterin aldolase